MRWLCFLLLFSGCATPKQPKTHTPAPSVASSKHAIVEAKDYLSRAQLSNRDISKLIKELEGLKK